MAGGRKKGFTMSADAKAAISAAQKARWAKWHKEQGRKKGQRPSRKAAPAVQPSQLRALKTAQQKNDRLLKKLEDEIAAFDGADQLHLAANGKRLLKRTVDQLAVEGAKVRLEKLQKVCEMLVVFIKGHELGEKKIATG